MLGGGEVGVAEGIPPDVGGAPPPVAGPVLGPDGVGLTGASPVGGLGGFFLLVFVDCATVKASILCFQRFRLPRTSSSFF